MITEKSLATVKTKEEAKEIVIEWILKQGFKRENILLWESNNKSDGWSFGFLKPHGIFIVYSDGRVRDDQNYFSEENAHNHKEECGCHFCTKIEENKIEREEHLSWCKERALEYVERGDIVNAWGLFFSDMKKHNETAGHETLILGSSLMLTGQLSTPEKMKKFIKDFG